METDKEKELNAAKTTKTNYYEKMTKLEERAATSATAQIFAQNYAYNRIGGSKLRDVSISTVKLQLKVNGMEMGSLPLYRRITREC